MLFDSPHPLLSTFLQMSAVHLRRLTAAFLAFRNKQHAASRVRLGKAGVVVDTSLETRPNAATHITQELEDGITARNEKAFDDLTDSQNEDFIFVL